MKRLLIPLLLLTCALPAGARDSLTIAVHVIYGSKPLADTEHKWFGGKWGGHIGLEISPGKIVHFYGGGRFRTFGRKSEPGVFAVSTKEAFYCTFDCDSSKRMEVRIPVTAAQAKHLDSISEYYVEHPPYPYAFFGMRCTAACYHLLSHAGIYPDYRKSKMIRKFFYPRRLRKRLMRSAKKHHWDMQATEGRTTRKWDHD